MVNFGQSLLGGTVSTASVDTGWYKNDTNLYQSLKSCEFFALSCFIFEFLP